MFSLSCDVFNLNVGGLPSGNNCYIALKMPIEIIDSPIETMMIFHRYVDVFQRDSEGNHLNSYFFHHPPVLCLVPDWRATARALPSVASNTSRPMVGCLP